MSRTFSTFSHSRFSPRDEHKEYFEWINKARHEETVFVLALYRWEKVRDVYSQLQTLKWIQSPMIHCAFLLRSTKIDYWLYVNPKYLDVKFEFVLSLKNSHWLGPQYRKWTDGTLGK